MDKNRFVAEKLGLCWHEYDPDYDVYCKKCRVSIGDGNPDFSTDAGAVELLRLVQKRDYYLELINSIGQMYNFPDCKEFLIEDRYITTKGALLNAVAEYLGWGK